jgi:hypothetical protein
MSVALCLVALEMHTSAVASAVKYSVQNTVEQKLFVYKSLYNILHGENAIESFIGNSSLTAQCLVKQRFTVS